LASQGKGFAETANGRVSVDYTLLDSVRLGGIEMQNVEALITPGMAGDSVLLGMSFLQHLQLSQHQGVLTLRVP
jgi:aspartyl protease family protein